MELRGKVATLLNEVLVLVGQKNPTPNAQFMVGLEASRSTGWITDARAKQESGGMDHKAK